MRWWDLSLEDCQAFEVTLAWMRLGNCNEEARDEIKRLSPQGRRNPFLLSVMWDIATNLQDWEWATEIGRTDMEVDPDGCSSWERCVEALYRTRRYQEALDTFVPLVANYRYARPNPCFGRSERRSPPIFVFRTLAACACRLGDIARARSWLKEAFSLAAEYGKVEVLQAEVLRNPDLEPLWPELDSFKPLYE